RRGILGGVAVAVLEVDRQGDPRRRGQRADVVGDLVEGCAAVDAAEGEREAGARRGQGGEAECLEHACRPRVPWVRDQERLARVQRDEGGSLIRLASSR